MNGYLKLIRRWVYLCGETLDDEEYPDKEELIEIFKQNEDSVIMRIFTRFLNRG